MPCHGGVIVLQGLILCQVHNHPLTAFRINTCEKPGEGGPPTTSVGRHARPPCIAGASCAPVAFPIQFRLPTTANSLTRPRSIPPTPLRRTRYFTQSNQKFDILEPLGTGLYPETQGTVPEAIMSGVP